MEENNDLNIGGTPEETKVEETVESPVEEVEVIHETADGEVIPPAVEEEVAPSSE